MRHSWQWTVDASANQQIAINLLFSPSSPASVLADARPVVVTMPCFDIKPFSHWLLQHYAHWPFNLLACAFSLPTKRTQLITNLQAHAHITKAMWSLHWLPVAYYKQLYAVYNGTSPFYIADTTTIIFTLPSRSVPTKASLTDIVPVLCLERKLSLWQIHMKNMLWQLQSGTPQRYLHSRKSSKHTFSKWHITLYG